MSSNHGVLIPSPGRVHALSAGTRIDQDFGDILTVDGSGVVAIIIISCASRASIHRGRTIEEAVEAAAVGDKSLVE